MSANIWDVHVCGHLYYRGVWGDDNSHSINPPLTPSLLLHSVHNFAGPSSFCTFRILLPKCTCRVSILGGQFIVGPPYWDVTFLWAPLFLIMLDPIPK